MGYSENKKHVTAKRAASARHAPNTIVTPLGSRSTGCGCMSMYFKEWSNFLMVPSPLGYGLRVTGYAGLFGMALL